MRPTNWVLHSSFVRKAKSNPSALSEKTFQNLVYEQIPIKTPIPMGAKDNIMEITQTKLPRSFPSLFLFLSFFFDENRKSCRSAPFSGRGAWKSLADDEARVADCGRRCLSFFSSTEASSLDLSVFRWESLVVVETQHNHLVNWTIML